MGNDLNVIYKGKHIASLSRKHNYTFSGWQNLPSEEEIAEHVEMVRRKVYCNIVSYSAWLADETKKITEQLDEIAQSVDSLLDYFQDTCETAGRMRAIHDLTNQIDDNGDFSDEIIEVIDDYELIKRTELDEKYKEAKENYMENLRNMARANGDYLEYKFDQE